MSIPGVSRKPDFSELDLHVARARVVLSITALVAVYVDPAAGGLFHLSAGVLVVLLGHLGYSIATYVALSNRLAPTHLTRISTVLDVAFATAVALCTEGGTSPSYVFFVFAIV